MLVRTGRKRGDPHHWLLFKEQDEAARKAEQLDVLEKYPNSVLTGRSIEQIAADRDAVWSTASGSRLPSGSHLPEGTPPIPPDLQVKQGPARQAGPIRQAGLARLAPVRLAGARKTPLPSRIEPAMPRATRTPPTGEQWWHEIKHDGYRMICRITAAQARFISRNGKDWTERLPWLAQQLSHLAVRQAILDGEVVAMNEDGTSSFQQLQNTILRGDDRQLKYYVFDLLYLDGYDLQAVRLAQRKELLRQLLLSNNRPCLILSEHIQGDGPLVFQQACKLGAEGIVSKRAAGKYLPGRKTDWLKTKCLRTGEFLIGGYTRSTVPQQPFGALLLGRRNEAGELVHVGRVGTGFSAQTFAQLGGRLKDLLRADSPFANLDAPSAGRDVRWLRPDLIVEVEYQGWTEDGLLRMASYRGLREDMDVAELPTAGPEASSASERGAWDNVPLGRIHDITLTHPDRVMYPEQGITKLDIATYYALVASRMLPHVIDRPLALVRCPRGCMEKCFFQKHAPSGLPDSVKRVPILSDHGAGKTRLAIHDLAGLLALVQFSTLEIHVWGARIDCPDRPDRMIFDIDPDTTLPWSRVVTAAFELRDLLSELGLVSFVKTTGGKGLHVVLPIRRVTTWEELQSFSQQIGRMLAQRSPGRYTTNPTKAARQGKVYIDSLRNRKDATAIAPFSTRARPGAGVALPVEWDELHGLRSGAAFHLRNIARRLEMLDHDPWSDLFEVRQAITQRMVRLAAEWGRDPKKGRA
jgi:bifunctional non-homologous end joining protein LigD